MKSKLLFASLIAMLASMEAQAVPISNPALSAGTSKIYLETSPGILTSVTVSQANLDSALFGAGNVELGKFGSEPATTLTGNFAGAQVTLSSLIITDWTTNSDALAKAYITGAASSIGLTLSSSQLATAEDVFLNGTGLGLPASAPRPWQYVSDPNVSDVNLINGKVVVGLDGLKDGSAFLTGMFGPLGVVAPAGSTASEVVKVTYQGSTGYAYGFSATPTGYQTSDRTHSYDGRFTVTVPEPATLALLGFGIAGLGFMRRRNERSETLVA